MDQKWNGQGRQDYQPYDDQPYQGGGYQQYNNGGYNNSGYNNGGYNSGGYNNGGYNNGGYNNGYNNDSYYQNSRYYGGAADTEAITQQVITRSFLVMLASLLITAFTATITAMNVKFFSSAMESFVVLAIVEFLLVIGAQFAISKRNAVMAGTLYLGYTILNGILLSSIFYVYEIGSIQDVFFITALLFGVMAVYGIFTRKDLSSIGSLAMMLLLGVIMVTFVNALFLHSAGLDLMIDYAVVVIFVGLTAYDTQKMKRMAATATMQDVNVVALYCGMELYLDFINLFLRLLRLMANSRD